MCKKFHRFCNCEYEPNIDLDNYIINYLNKILTKKRRKGLRRIAIRKQKVLDFYYHINGIIHETEFYIMSMFYRYKGDLRARDHKFKI